jgi:hypothetical protein
MRVEMMPEVKFTHLTLCPPRSGMKRLEDRGSTRMRVGVHRVALVAA